LKRVTGWISGVGVSNEKQIAKNLQLATFNLQPATLFNLQLATFNLQPATNSMTTAPRFPFILVAVSLVDRVSPSRSEITAIDL
jgi:hypothetical protein